MGFQFNFSPMKKILLTASCCTAFFALFAQNADSIFIRRIADQILTSGKAYEDLRVLTKQIGARLSGSPQMVKAEQWGLKVFQSLAPDSAWLQQCMVPHWVRGGKDEASALRPAIGKRNNNRDLDILALGNSKGTPEKGIMASVIEVKSFEDLELKKDQVKNKIVFYNYQFNPTYIRTFEAYRDAVVYRGQGASRAAKYGAVAVIIRSMTHSTDNYPHTGSLRYDSAYPQIPAVAVGLQDADWMSSMLARGMMMVRLKTNGHFLPDTIAHNVIAELTGSQFPGEFITIGAHLDSWDQGEGAHDDGAGVVQVIEILRVLKTLGYQPKHSIRFVLFANEENGLRGGVKYAEEAKKRGEKHLFALESDAGGFTPRGFGFDGTDAQFQKIAGWQSLLEPYGTTEIVKGGGGADIGPLKRTFNTAVASFVPDSQRYFDYHHARNDVFETVNKRELQLGAVNMAALIYLVDKYGL